MIPTISLEEKILNRLHEQFPDPKAPGYPCARPDAWDVWDAQVKVHCAAITARVNAIVDVLMELAEERLRRTATPPVIPPTPDQCASFCKAMEKDFPRATSKPEGGAS